MSDPLIWIMGVSGCGKTTVAKDLAATLNATYLEGDDFHPAANVAAMAAGRPLTDEMRWPWLDALATAAATQSGPVVVSCSGLKRAYRDRLRERAGGVMIVLHTDAETLRARMTARRNHYMPLALLESQLATLELPTAEEPAVCVVEAAQSPADVLVAAKNAANHLLATLAPPAPTE